MASTKKRSCAHVLLTVFKLKDSADCSLAELMKLLVSPHLHTKVEILYFYTKNVYVLVSVPGRARCHHFQVESVAQHSGYIASAVVEETGCGSQDSPWCVNNTLTFTYHLYYIAKINVNRWCWGIQKIDR